MQMESCRCSSIQCARVFCDPDCYHGAVLALNQTCVLVQKDGKDVGAKRIINMCYSITTNSKFFIYNSMHVNCFCIMTDLSQVVIRLYTLTNFVQNAHILGYNFVNPTTTCSPIIRSPVSISG